MNDAPDLAAVTEIQQKVWSEGDFAMVAGLVTIVAEELAEALEIVARRTRASTSPAAAAAALGGPAQPGAIRSAPTTSPPCWSAAASGPQPSGSRSSSSRPTPRTCPSRTPASTSPFDLRGDVRPRPAADRRRAAAGRQAGRPDRDGELGPRRRRRGDVHDDRQARPAAARGRAAARSGAPRSGSASCSATASPSLASSGATSRQGFRSADHYIEFFRTYFGPIKMAFERVGPEGEPALRPTCAPISKSRNTAGERALVLEAEYLQVIATRA